MRSLEWGFTNGSFNEEEVLDIINDVVPASQAPDAGPALLLALCKANLLFEFQTIDGSRRYRSRFAEMMRLLAANRQLFDGRPWREGASLIADFRVDRRPRRFPARHRRPTDVLADHASVLARTPLRQAFWQALTADTKMALSDFQERATVRLVDPPTDSGTIVTAGTGSGKTIAFYLPAMIRISEAIDTAHWVKAIAIYPRIELLKDQFAEAFRMARMLDTTLQSRGRRPIKIAALFAATPRQVGFDMPDEWQRRGRDFICPWMRCQKCKGELVWRATDIEAGREQLNCAQPGCEEKILQNHIVLTRRRLQKEPPDILFTTTEILNQRLSDQWMRGLFGVGVPKGRTPLYALLDEVHTYEGASGAQVALTLRRWRYLLKAPISWVGLSATLRNADRFFADLTGVTADAVKEITPLSNEYEEKGAEYQIVLRGDPRSRVALLSATIQTAMLVPRLLDPPNAKNASGVFGRRAFLFTDDLDVTNRLFDDLRDAEAYTIYGRPDPRRLPLAHLRGSGSDAAIRDAEGQRWRLCEDIGHPLNQRLIVGRTTSQDAGVNQNANVIVATAALEVGFNDPLVGAVIQHKAPRGMASFLQRKGRAGRDRDMRPIMVTILSDYGRDRAFYQSFEHLFDPAIQPQHLPILNPYVLKIQAVFALFDWLADRAEKHEKAWQWDILSRPVKGENSRVRAVADRTRRILAELVQGQPQTIADLQTYLMGALGITAEVAQSVLWEAPRPLLLEAVPTLLRRLYRDWKLAFPTPNVTEDMQVDHHPLPDFVPRTLFNDLSLPEVTVVLPPADAKSKERRDALPIVQALNHLVPGRVTRRFAYERGGLSHWVPVNPDYPEQTLVIDDYAEVNEFVGEFQGRLNDPADQQMYRVYRPWVIRLTSVGREEALPSSNARLVWHTDMVANGESLNVPVPVRTSWSDYIQSINFYLHRFRSSVSVRRFAPIARANVRKRGGDHLVTVHFVGQDGLPAAVGFEIEVDGFRVDLRLPRERLRPEVLPVELLADCRVNYLREAFQSDPELPGDVNRFQRDWLFQFLHSAVLAKAATHNIPVDEAVEALLKEERVDSAILSAMNVLFGTHPEGFQDESSSAHSDEGDEPTEEGDESNGHAQGSSSVRLTRLQRDLTALISRPEVHKRLCAIARQFSAPDTEAFTEWLRRQVLESVGEAMLQACIAAAPRHATVDTLLVDICDDPETDIASVWITEATIGGAGVLEAFAERFVSEPRMFFTALEAALAPTDLELVDEGLRRILELSINNKAIGEQIACLRATVSHKERAGLWRSFSQQLAQSGGIDVSHALSVSLNNRLLRPGSGPELDRMLLVLQEHWTDLERRLGLAIGVREFAYVASQEPSLSSQVKYYLAKSLPSAATDHITVVAAIINLLWPRGNEVRQHVLRSYNPFREARSTDPAIVQHLLLERTVPTVELGEVDWYDRLVQAFRDHGSCRLAVDMIDAAALHHAVVRLVATAVDMGVLQFFPVVERVERGGGKLTVSLILREQL